MPSRPGEVIVSPNFIETEKVKQNEKTEENVSNERTRKKKPGEKTNEKLSNLLDKVFKALVLRILTELGKRIDEHSENFNKELENIKKEPASTGEYNN